jgi:hypothetical protein
MSGEEKQEVVQPVELPKDDLEELVKIAESPLGGAEITPSNVFGVCVRLMQVVERYPKLEGPKKKELVVRTLQRIIEKNGGSSDLMAVVPSFIDLAISIDRKNIQIAVEGCFKFFGCGRKK